MTAPFSSGAAGGLVLTGVTMELAGTHGPASTVPDVTLAVGPEGLSVTQPSGAATTVPWPSVSWARCGEGGILADGSPAVAVAATVSGRLVRWLVPEEQMPPPRAMAIDHLLTARTGTPAATDPARVEGPAAGPAVEGAPVPPGATGAPVSGALPRSEAPFGASPVDRRAPAPGTRPGHPVAPFVPLPPLPAAGHAAGRRRPAPSLGVMVAWLLIVALVLVGAGLYVAASIPVHPRSGVQGTGAGAPGSTGGSGASGQDRAETLAATVSLRLADLPSGWSAVRTRSGPLSGFVNSGHSVRSSPPGAAQAVSRYRRCLGVRTAAVPLVSAGTTPLAESTSGAFAGPSTDAPMQVASITDVFATPAPVRQAVGQLEHRRFASCFGAAVGTELARSLAAQAPTGVTTGTATTQSLPLPRWAGIRATGVDVELPLDVRGEATSVQLGFVFVTGAEVEATLVSFSTTGVPQDVSRALAATLEEEMAAAGSA